MVVYEEIVNEEQILSEEYIFYFYFGDNSCTSQMYQKYELSMFTSQIII
jgi:hypothetical protein